MNEVFERLNTGGMPLSKADLLFSRIKAVYPDFESLLMEFSKKLFARCKIGLDAYDLLQLLHLIVKRRSRIDENVDGSQIGAFKKTWDDYTKFLAWRREQMLDYMEKHYGIKVRGEEKDSNEYA